MLETRRTRTGISEKLIFLKTYKTFKYVPRGLHMTLQNY